METMTARCCEHMQWLQDVMCVCCEHTQWLQDVCEHTQWLQDVVNTLVRNTHARMQALKRTRSRNNTHPNRGINHFVAGGDVSSHAHVPLSRESIFRLRPVVVFMSGTHTDMKTNTFVCAYKHKIQSNIVLFYIFVI
jgi:hypothetical protein